MSANERTPAQSSRRRLFSGPEPPSSNGDAGLEPRTAKLVQTSAESESSEQRMELQPSPSPSVVVAADNKPKRTGSLSLFFRKVRKVFKNKVSYFTFQPLRKAYSLNP